MGLLIAIGFFFLCGWLLSGFPLLTVRSPKSQNLQRKDFGMLLVLGALVGTSLLPVSVLHASTMKGTPIDIDGIDDAAATVDKQTKSGAGYIFAVAGCFGGLGALMMGYPMSGATTAAGSVGTVFVSRIINSAQSTAPAATPDLLQTLSPDAWWAPFTVPLYLPLLLLQLMRQPTFWVCLALALLLVRTLHRRGYSLFGQVA